MEPIAIREHAGLTFHPEWNGKQAVLMCNSHFNMGLSIVWARPATPEYTGLYMNGVDTYEVALIVWDYEGEIRPWDFTLLPYKTDVIGHLTIEDIDRLSSDIMMYGLDGYKNFVSARLSLKDD